MSDTKRKISAWVPVDLYDKVETIGYTSPTIAVTKALEMLVRAEAGDNPETTGDFSGDDRRQPETEYNLALVKTQAKYEGLQMLLEEKDKRIDSLENDLIKAGQREEDLKQIHNNYMVQIQHLINQKAIGSPKEAIRKQPEDKPAAERRMSPQKGEKALIKKTCKNCNETFLTTNPKKETCSDKCRSAYSRRK